jgi:uncharacterized protein YkwD
MIYKKDSRPMKYHKGNIVAIISAVIVLIFVGNFVYDAFFQTASNNSIQNGSSPETQSAPEPNPTVYTAQPEQIPPEQRGYGITPYGVLHGQSQQQSNPTPEIQPSLANTTDLEHSIHTQINYLREQNGLKPLIYDEKLATIAREHSKDMAVNNYYDHTSPNGVGLQDRYKSANYLCFSWMGENIQQQSTSDSNLASSAFQTWIDSPEHRDNILEQNFIHEGIGAYVYSGTVFITEDFC